MEPYKIWNFGGEKLEFDLYDAENMERYERAMEELQNRQSTPKEVEKISENLKKQCEDYFEFFNILFNNANTAEQLFNGKKNLSKCMEAYYDFLEFVANQGEQERGRLAGLREKYSKGRIKK